MASLIPVASSSGGSNASAAPSTKGNSQYVSLALPTRAASFPLAKIFRSTPSPAIVRHRLLEALSSVLPERAVLALDKLHELPEGGLLYGAVLDGLSRIMGEALEAFLAQDRGQQEKFVESMSRAMALDRERELTVWMLWHRRVAGRLMRMALEAGIDEEHVRRTIRNWDLEPDVPAHRTEKWPWPLRVRTLGLFRLTVDESPVAGSRKGQRKPMALLEAVVAHGEGGVAEEALSDDLWPESDGAAAHAAFTVTVHRLRRMLGSSTLLRMEEGRLSLDPNQCWVDAWAFERLLDEARPLWRSHPAEAACLTEQALTLYQGPFLPESMGAPWTIQVRERLRSRLVRATQALGRHLEGAGHWAQALEGYERALEADPLLEEVHQRVMGCLSRMGRRAEALAAYERCRRLLQKVLGVDPSPETEAMARSLRGG